MIPLIIAGVIVLIIVIWAAASYNGFIQLRNKTEEAYSAIDVSLKKRYDLIPNYVETVKGYAKHEKETLQNVISARNSAMESSGPEERMANDRSLKISVCSSGKLSGSEGKSEFYQAAGSAGPSGRRNCRIQTIL